MLLLSVRVGRQSDTSKEAGKGARTQATEIISLFSQITRENESHA